MLVSPRRFAALTLLVACGPAPKAEVPLAAAPTLVTEPAAPALVAKTAEAPPPKNTVPSAPADFAAGRLERAEFNRIAAEMALPYFWVKDENGNKQLDPAELATYRGPVSAAEVRSGNGFSAEFANNYAKMVVWHDAGICTADAISRAEKAKKNCATPHKFRGAVTSEAKDAECPTQEDIDRMRRMAKVCADLAQGRQTLVQSDFSASPEGEKALARHMMTVAGIIEKLYGEQMGLGKLEAPKDEPSKMMMFRNQSPKCAFPKSTGVKGCDAGVALPKGPLTGLYPESLTAKNKFCDAVSGANKTMALGEDAKSPFTVIVDNDAKSGYVAVPYTKVYGDDMKAVAAELKAAEKDLGDAEPALRAYLAAAAQSFLDNNWVPADEAWAKMGVENSNYYLRVGPDEVYDEPCSVKALFHLSFARINPSSKKWQGQLGPMKAEMEAVITELAGAPYKAREVSFKLPDFIEIILNAGDSRSPYGTTIGQSLPNFGPVANEGRGRTVAMTNFYQDADSTESAKVTAESLLCKPAMEFYTSAPEPKLMSTVLHEAAHNLGPAHQYLANGKVDREAFGGPLASTLEEFKAQSAALFYTDWLVGRGTLPREIANKAHLQDLLWNFGHISRGMYDEAKHPRNYSQLSAIQLGLLMKAGAVAWNAKEPAANGKDVGCFSFAPTAYPAATREMLKTAAGIKARGDKKLAEQLVQNYVDAPSPLQKSAMKVITERVGRASIASFVYSVKID